MSKQIYIANNGAIDLNEIIGIKGDSLRATVAMRGGAEITVSTRTQDLIDAWVEYREKNEYVLLEG